jgi:hypothetical protein
MDSATPLLARRRLCLSGLTRHPPARSGPGPLLQTTVRFCKPQSAFANHSPLLQNHSPLLKATVRVGKTAFRSSFPQSDLVSHSPLRFPAVRSRRRAACCRLPQAPVVLLVGEHVGQLAEALRIVGGPAAPPPHKQSTQGASSRHPPGRGALLFQGHHLAPSPSNVVSPTALTAYRNMEPCAPSPGSSPQRRLYPWLSSPL